MVPTIVRTVDIVWAVLTVTLAFAELGCAFLDERRRQDGGRA